MDKAIYELTGSDLRVFPVWRFPMDESVSDEAIVRPVADAAALNLDSQLIVRTQFLTRLARAYVGYVYWCDSEFIGHRQPVILLDDGPLNFWNGMVLPSEDFVVDVRRLLGPNAFPVSYASETVFGLTSVSGQLRGLYFVNANGDEDVVQLD